MGLHLWQNEISLKGQRLRKCLHIFRIFTHRPYLPPARPYPPLAHHSRTIHPRTWSRSQFHISIQCCFAWLLVSSIYTQYLYSSQYIISPDNLFYHKQPIYILQKTRLFKWHADLCNCRHSVAVHIMPWHLAGHRILWGIVRMDRFSRELISLLNHLLDHGNLKLSQTKKYMSILLNIFQSIIDILCWGLALLWQSSSKQTRLSPVLHGRRKVPVSQKQPEHFLRQLGG